MIAPDYCVERVSRQRTGKWKPGGSGRHPGERQRQGDFIAKVARTPDIGTFILSFWLSTDQNMDMRLFPISQESVFCCLVFSILKDMGLYILPGFIISDSSLSYVDTKVIDKMQLTYIQLIFIIYRSDRFVNAAIHTTLFTVNLLVEFMCFSYLPVS